MPLENTATETVLNHESAVTPRYGLASGLSDHETLWFPMRIAYGRAERTMKVKRFLEEIKVEHFLPMTHRKQLVDGRRKLVLVPALDGLIFLHIPKAQLIDIKSRYHLLLSLRFMMWTPHSETERPHIITIPDKDMENFKRVASVEDDQVMFLANKDFSNKIGRKVVVTEGNFAGVKGTIYRVKKDRRVVITIENVCSVAIAYINPNYLQEIEE